MQVACILGRVSQVEDVYCLVEIAGPPRMLVDGFNDACNDLFNVSTCSWVEICEVDIEAPGVIASMLGWLCSWSGRGDWLVAGA